jgi:hypothetical protein
VKTYKNTPISKIVAHVEQLVHHNLMNDALRITSAFFENEMLENAFDEISSEQAHMGYMTEDALARRRSLVNQLKDHIESICDQRTRKVFAFLL